MDAGFTKALRQYKRGKTIKRDNELWNDNPPQKRHKMIFWGNY
jgi:hypothetical protein